MGAFTESIGLRKWWRERPGWERVKSGIDGAAFRWSGGKRHGDVMTVIVSIARENDGLRWLHVSVARPDYLPSYKDLCLAKAAFIGDDRKAIQVMPAKVEHVNIHPNCLHLWHCLDGDPLPDFTRGTGMI